MMTADPATVTLPGGLRWEGRRYHQAQLRQLVGHDEAFLVEDIAALPQAPWTTALLARCLVRLGPLTTVTPDAVRMLTAGDREALLLHLRRLTLGNRMSCLTTCPACSEKMDLDLAVNQLLVPPYADPPATHEMTIQEGNTAYTVHFRLPTGEDQEAVAAPEHRTVQAAADALLQRCIEQVSRNGAADVPPEDWPPTLATQLSARMVALDAQAEIGLDLACPYCEQAFSVLFDTAAFFRKELDQHVQYLYREVHLLALYYHWSEHEIMNMPPTKRRRYLHLLTDALSETQRT